MTRTFRIDVEGDPAGAVAALTCLQAALQMSLHEVAKLQGPEWRHGLAQLEAQIMSKIKNIAPTRGSEATEARAMPIGHESVALTFHMVREARDKNNPPGT